MGRQKYIRSTIINLESTSCPRNTPSQSNTHHNGPYHCGNGDGRIDPDETVDLGITIENDGGGTFSHIITHGKANLPPYSWIVTPPYSDSALIKVVAYDAHKNLGQDVSDSLFTTADLIPPEEVEDLSVGIAYGAKSSSGDVTLWWSPVTDNWGLNYYVVYRGISTNLMENSIGIASGTEYLDTGAVGDTTNNYFYMVKAVDLGGNKSIESNCVGEFDSYLTNVEPADTTQYSR